jgi:hypothetical protein
MVSSVLEVCSTGRSSLHNLRERHGVTGDMQHFHQDRIETVILRPFRSASSVHAEWTNRAPRE